MTTDERTTDAQPGDVVDDLPRDDTPEWTHDPVTGEDVWTPQEEAIVPTGCPE